MRGFLVLASFLAMMSGAGASAQSPHQLKCAVRYQEQVIPMYWFPGDSSHHLNGPDSFSVIVNEKSTPGKVEITIVEMVEDEVWDKLNELLKSDSLNDEMRTKIRNLGRSRITTAYVGLYEDIIHFEHHLGSDRNTFEISCVKLEHGG